MDQKLKELFQLEEERQKDTLQLIPSENYASKAVRELVGSPLANKYSEGYAGRRYYQGNRYIDEIERLAISRAKELFGVPHVNVQPYSGSPANSAVLFGLLEQGDTIMGMELASGGHLTHGQPKITFSGKYFNSVQFGVGSDGTLDYFEIERLAVEKRPKLMIIGTTAYPLALDWKKFSEIAETVGAYLVADISHVVGLVIGGVYPSPVEYAHVITTTTHKTLRGPRGAMIMVTKKGLEKDPELADKVDKAVFPGLQGGPHNNTTAGIAQALYEASQPEFKKYAEQVVKNAKVLANELTNPTRPGLVELVGGGTDCHLILVDLRPLGLSGNVVAEALEVAGIVVNRNSVPGDTSPFYPSGIRLGTPSVTTRGMQEKEMKQIAEWILKVVEIVKDEKLPEEKEARNVFLKEFKTRIQSNEELLSIAKEVKEFVSKFPTP
ncbi:MAG: serine hydroxymethyltransferase [bacterium]|nr:serine hydroxymethyltransferase [bacterium]